MGGNAREAYGGGSTLEQQLARVVTNRYEPTIRRKIEETLLASLLVGRIPKTDIPGLYLSVAYLVGR
jgi:membrane carboxypeptidase/penicillin-binding protein